ncbi:glycosyltransferase family 4 protein [Haladaptatus sp. NG-SE-30]
MSSCPRPTFIYPDYGQSSPCNHYAHRDFGEAVNAEFVGVSPPSIMPAGHQTIGGKILQQMHLPQLAEQPIILEYSEVLYTAPKIKRQYPNQPLILLASHHKILGANIHIQPGGISKAVRNLHRRLECRTESALLRYCDGIIAVSDFLADYFRIRYPNKIIRAVAPHLNENLHCQLLECDPDLNSNHAVFVGVARDHKGVNQLVESWPRVRERHPNAKLSIIGKNHPVEFEKISGVNLEGFVKNLTDEFSTASLYIHPARIDPFAVSVTEAMAAGIPAIVTDTTGAKKAVEQVECANVVPSSSVEISDAILNYFDQPLEKRKIMSDKSREIASNLTKDTQTKKFREAYKSVINFR